MVSLRDILSDSMPKKEIYYFESTGEINTNETLKIAKKRADKQGIKNLVIASTRGNTGVKAVEYFKGYNVVIVPHVTGLREPGQQELTEENKKIIEEKGGQIVIAAHSFSGINRAIQAKWDTMYPVGIIAQTLRLFGQGMKVVVEIAAMAADAGVPVMPPFSRLNVPSAVSTFFILSQFEPAPEKLTEDWSDPVSMPAAF